MNKTAIILIGIQASGKSSFYRERFSDHVHINLDTLHTRNKEQLLLQQCLEEGASFVVDNTNPTQADREKYIRQAKAYGYSVHGYYFRSAVADCLKRNQERTGKARVPDRAISGTSRKLEIPRYQEGFDALFYVRIEADSFIVEKWSDSE